MNIGDRRVRRYQVVSWNVELIPSYNFALACISFEMDKISFRISLQKRGLSQKSPSFVINFVLYKKKSCISHSPKRKSLRICVYVELGEWQNGLHIKRLYELRRWMGGWGVEPERPVARD